MTLPFHAKQEDSLSVCPKYTLPVKVLQLDIPPLPHLAHMPLFSQTATLVIHTPGIMHTTAIPLPIKLYVALQVGVAVILSQRPTPSTLEYSTNRFCAATYVLAGVLKSQVFKLCFGAKSFVLGKKIGKVMKRRRSVKPTCANGGTNCANGGTNASFCTSGDFQFFLAPGQICFEFDSATVKGEKKKRKNEEEKN